LKRFQVSLTEDAARDLEGLFDYIAEHDDPVKAGRVLDRIEQAVVSLATFPQRGSHPNELLSLGIRDYRQSVAGPYRVIYRLVGRRVYVYLIADGRRDMQALLARRLLEA
jgi:toxin ParE1/3/4